MHADTNKREKAREKKNTKNEKKRRRTATADGSCASSSSPMKSDIFDTDLTETLLTFHTSEPVDTIEKNARQGGAIVEGQEKMGMRMVLMEAEQGERKREREREREREKERRRGCMNVWGLNTIRKRNKRGRGEKKVARGRMWSIVHTYFTIHAGVTRLCVREQARAQRRRDCESTG
jgi:hypothetical protein